MKLGIGIDTGGTYTDAVVYDFDSKRILGSAKSLTTRHDLTQGILGAIDGLPAELTAKAKLISLSTTLATNACVEDKGGRAKLIFFGGEKAVLDKYGRQYGLPPSEDICIQESFTSFSGNTEKEINWAVFEKEIESGFENLDGVGIVEINSMKNGAANEKKAKEIFQSRYNIPVVCGHELFNEFNSLRRGASTLLNAGLFPVISDFLASVKKALEARNIKPEAMVIVRSDGSVMSEQFASLRPVETLLCGPAASAIGCTHLADNPNSIVVDMGGTTTDIAFINNGLPVTVTGGVSIGKWKTFVNGLYVKTFGLGGDTAVHYSGENLYLEEYRVVPLCVAAADYPAILESLGNITVRKHSKFLYEHYILVKDISESNRYSEEEKAFCSALKKKPLSISDAAEAVGKDIYTLKVDNLLKDGVIQLCGLTPTDIMHIKGDFTKYNSRASLLGAQFVAANVGVSVEELCEQVYSKVKKRLYVNIVKSMLENKYPDYLKNGISADVERFIEDNYNEANSPDKLLSTAFKTTYSLIGVGAPIKVFLEDVAGMLGTKAYIPENYEVANALGAIVGSISASCSVEIKENNSGENAAGFIVFGKKGNMVFEELEEAIKFAVKEAEEAARNEAVKRGAVGEITVRNKINTNEAQSRDCEVYLGTTVTAFATGSTGF